MVGSCIVRASEKVMVSSYSKELPLEWIVFNNKGYEIRHHCLRLSSPGMPFLFILTSFEPYACEQSSCLEGVGFLDLHVEPTQILQFAGLPFGSNLSISLQNYAARTIASKNEIGHFICLQVSEKRPQAFSRCDQPGSNSLVEKRSIRRPSPSNTEPSTEDCGVVIVVPGTQRMLRDGDRLADSTLFHLSSLRAPNRTATAD